MVFRGVSLLPMIVVAAVVFGVFIVVDTELSVSSTPFASHIVRESDVLERLMMLVLRSIC